MTPRSHDPKTEIDLSHIEATETVHHESARSKKPKETGVRQLNLTSMLDVCFQLLIFFILTANFAIDEGVLPADLPQGVPPEPNQIQPPPDDPVIIRLTPIDAEGNVSIWISNASPIPNPDFAKLYDNLAGRQYNPQTGTGQLLPENPIIIQPSPRVRWEHVVSAFNAVIRAKYTTVSFAQAG